MPDQTHQEQRAAWRKAIADLRKAQRNRRGRRPGPQVTGVVKLPGTEAAGPDGNTSPRPGPRTNRNCNQD
jgi:hypothetical protein